MLHQLVHRRSEEEPLSYAYDRALKPDEVCVHLCAHGAWNDFEPLCEAVRGHSRRFGFSFEPVGWPDVGGIDMAPCRRRLLIVVSPEPFCETLATRLLHLVGTGYTNASAAFSYRSESEMLSCRPAVERYKAASLDRINFLRPVAGLSGVFTVPASKIADNAVCDSVRIKYKPAHVAGPVSLPLYAKSFFGNASRAFAEEKLYHRSSTDGYFACRDESGDGFYITATKTCKVNLLLSRISHVRHYDRSSNTLEYSGAFLPSSDSVEAAIVFSELPEIRTLVHTHASDLFTRNTDYVHKVSVPPLPYGEPQLGDVLTRALRREPDGFVIMEDHGEIFASSDRGVSPTLTREVERARANAAR
jgi:hypothetical protein